MSVYRSSSGTKILLHLITGMIKMKDNFIIIIILNCYKQGMVVCVLYFRVMPGLSLSEDYSLHISCNAVCYKSQRVFRCHVMSSEV